MRLLLKGYGIKICVFIALALSLVLANAAVMMPSANAASYVRIKNVWQNAYLYESDGKVKYGHPSSEDQYSHWELDNSKGYTRIKNRATGHYLNMEHKYDYVECTEIYDGWFSAFWVISDFEGSKRIRNLWKDRTFINIEGLSGIAQCTNIYDVWASARWTIEGVGSYVYGNPDLIVTEMSWTPETPSVKKEVKFSCTVTNKGSVAVAAGTKLKVSFLIDGNEVSWCDEEISSLASGASVKITANNGPGKKSLWLATSGSHNVRAFVDSVNGVVEDNETNNALDKTIQIGDSTKTQQKRGANLPFTEMEAENGKTDGTILGPSTVYREQASEASNRQCVKLDATGEYVEWVAPVNANSMVLRYCIPDAEKGKGIDASLSLYINGRHSRDLNLTSKYAWVYGEKYDWTNDPSKELPHKFYDEVRTFTERIKAGDKIKLQKDSSDTAAYYLIDLIDLENVGSAKTMPPNHISITSYGAKANDGLDDRNAILNCIKAAKAQKKSVWIPKGTFNIESGGIDVADVTIRGAGMWYTTLAGKQANFNCTGDNCRFYDFALFGEVDSRDNGSQADNAFSGWPGYGSVLDGIWVEHKKCGFWVGEERRNMPVNGLKIVNCRFRNLMADGVNFCNGTSNSVVENCHIRYPGDDGLATWSPSMNVGCNNNVFRNNTIQIPWLASGISIYGGSNHRVEDNLVYDTITEGSGVYISAFFDPIPFSGIVNVSRNTLVRCGTNEIYFGLAPGAIRLLAVNNDLKNVSIIIEDNEIVNAVQSGISIQGPLDMPKVVIRNTRIRGCSTYGINISDNAKGTASFENVSVTNAVRGGMRNEAGTEFKIVKVEGNSGW